MAGGVSPAKRRKIEETNIDETEDLYSCTSCLLGARTEMLYHSVQLMSDSFFNYLLGNINDTNAAQRSKSMGTVVVPVQVDCENCREEIEVKTEITATPVWDEQEESDESTQVSSSNRKARISHFQNFKVVNILPPETQQHTSLRICFHNEKKETEPEWSSLVPSNIDHFQIPASTEASQKTLITCARVQAKCGSSYIVFDAAEMRLLRLVFKLNAKSCSLTTSEDLNLGERFRMTVLRHPEHHKSAPAPSTLPHKNDNLLVHSTVKYLPYPSNIDLYELLKPHAKTTIPDVFISGHICDKKFVLVNRNCPSLGVLSCRDFNAQLYTDGTGTRIKVYVDGVWDLPVTGSDCEKLKDRGRQILLMLSLSPPWDNNGSFKPARCYINCVAVITNPARQ